MTDTISDIPPLTEQNLRETLDRISDQLCRAGDGDFDVAVQADSSDEAVERLEALINRVLDAARRGAEDLRLRTNDADSRMHAIVDAAADAVFTLDEHGKVESFNRAACELYGYSAEEVIGKDYQMLVPPAQRTTFSADLRRYLANEVSGPPIHREVIRQRRDGTEFSMEVSISSVQLAERRLIVVVGRDVADRKRAEQMIRESEQHLHAVLDAVRASIIVVDAEAHEAVYANDCAWELVGSHFDSVVAEVCRQYNCTLEQGESPATAKARTVESAEGVFTTSDGREIPVIKSVVPIERRGRRILVASFIDISDRKRVEAERETLHERLMEMSRQAGMAELATGVLHNVGNVLNSVNVSTTVLADRVRRSKIGRLAEVSEILRANEKDLGTFLSEDEKGKRLPDYLLKLANHLAEEQTILLGELDDLAKSVEHLKQIISTQQANARAMGVIELVSLVDVLNDALTVTATSFERYGIELVREYEDIPPVMIDRHKLLQILINLVRNAKHAVLDGKTSAKRLTLRLSRIDGDRVRIDVIDNGVGIERVNLTRIFSHGFTTKKDGHGFGLHSSALAAKDLGGSLTVHSDGPELGATFSLVLPVHCANELQGIPLTMPATNRASGAIT